MKSMTLDRPTWTLKDYDGILDKSLLEKLRVNARGTPYQDAVLNLVFGWKGAAYSVSSAPMMLKSIGKGADRFYTSKKSHRQFYVELAENRLCSDLRKRVRLDPGQVLALQFVLKEMADDVRDFSKKQKSGFDAGKEFTDLCQLKYFAFALRGAVWSTYQQVFSCFECFLEECLEIVGKPQKHFRISEVAKYYKDVLDPGDAERFNEPDFQTMKFIRHSITHKRGRMSKDLKGLSVPEKGDIVVLGVSELKRDFHMLQAMAGWLVIKLNLRTPA